MSKRMLTVTIQGDASPAAVELRRAEGRLARLSARADGRKRTILRAFRVGREYERALQRVRHLHTGKDAA